MTTLLNPTQAAAHLAISKKRLLALVRSKAVPAIRLNARVIRFNPATLDKWIERKETK